MIILEEIRSQNRATIERVESHHEEIRRELQDFRSDIRGEFRMVQGVLQSHGTDVRQLKADIASLKEQVARLDAVITTDYRERLQKLEQRVEALERRPA